MRAWATCLAMLMLSACASSGAPYITRPGAVSELDSRAFDVLAVSEALLDSAEKQHDEGSLNDRVKDAVNILIPIHNSTNVAWKAYRAAVGDDDETVKAQTLVDLLPDVRQATLTVIAALGGE